MLLDIGVGILVSIAGSELFNVSLSTFIILWSIFFALLPDIDVLPDVPALIRYKTRKGGFMGAHRHSIAHFPVIYILLSGLILLVLGPFWALLFFFNTLLHLLHDSLGIGWGIKWLWPFKKTAYKFFSDEQGRLASNFLASWDRDALRVVLMQYGNPRSILDTYLRLTPTLIIETAVLIVSLVTLILVL